jgi:putative hydrolase of the HAD superfamily
MEKKYTDIFFDLDRTLWDFDANSYDTFNEIFQKYNLNQYFRYFESFLETYRKINEFLWQDYRDKKISKEDLSWQRFHKTLQTCGCDSVTIAKSIALDYIKISPEKTKLFDGTINLLESLYPYFNMYIITNGFKEVQYNKLNNCGIVRYFRGIYVSEEIGHNKPYKEFFDIVFKQSNADRETSIVVGDDLEIDIMGAINAGVYSVWFNPNKITGTIKPNFEISKLNELLEIVRPV